MSGIWVRRHRFIAGHNSCELRRHLDSVPPGKAQTGYCRSVPGVGESCGSVFSASAVATPAPTLKPEPPAMDQLIQRLMAETQARQPAPAAANGSV